MKLVSQSFTENAVIPGEYCFCIPHERNRVCLGANRNPHLSWSDFPPQTRSFAIICHDPDVPSKGDDVNQEDRTVPASLPRVDFFHWILVDLPVSVTEIGAGTFSSEVVPHGKSGPAAPLGARQGINDYTNWFAGDGDMLGEYYGYDGPCPPWNDERPHRYVFTVFALDIERLPLTEQLSGSDARAAMAGHILAEATLTGRYSLNPKVLL